MKRILAAAIAATSFFPLAAKANEAALDGVLWRYEIVNGGAVIQAAEPIPGEDAQTELETLKIPADFDDVPVVAIGDGAFAENDKISEIKIPGGVVSIGSRAFKDCRNLKSVKLPDSTTEIGDRTFSGCRALKSVTLGANITNIAARTFRDCRSLASIDLPENLASIGDRAFADCAALHSVTIPRGVTNIAEWAFADCSALAVVVFLGTEPSVGEDAFARVNADCLFRASSAEGWSVEIPGVWMGHKIIDLAIETYRRKTLIFLPMIVGAIGTIAILVLAIVLRERRSEDDE